LFVMVCMTTILQSWQGRNRDPEGKSETKDEYLTVTHFGIISWSPEG
jgi:hypothetical protein